MGHIKGHDKRGTSCAVFYVNGGLGDDANNGTTIALAFDTIQKAFDKIADGTINDGDEVRIMGTTADATNYLVCTSLNPDWDQKEITITGANSAGIVDGTQVEIRKNSSGCGSLGILTLSATECERTTWANLHFNANDTALYCVKSSSSNYYQRWINCRFSQAIENGVEWVGANYWDFISCRFDNNAQHGLEMDGTAWGIAYRCLFDNNGAMGVETASLNSYRHRWIESVFYNNGTEGMDWVGAGGMVLNCVFDSNGSDGLLDNGIQIQSLRIGNIYSNNAHAGVRYIGGTDSVAFNELFYNNRNDTEDDSGTVDDIGPNGHMINYTPGASGYNPSFIDAPNFDFTPGPTFGANDLGIPTPYKWFGSTAGDPGLNKWVKTETVSIF